MRKFNIAIDGWSSCGKSTLARELARKLHFVYVDSGAMYRAVTLFAMRNNLIDDGEVDVETLEKRLGEIEISFVYNRAVGKSDTYLNGENVEKEIREMEVSSNVSEIARIKPVRLKLRELQRRLGSNKGVVMDGRDIGTVIFPNAELKIFMTASKEIRAKRRYDELKAKGLDITMEEVIENLEHRDHIDSNRKEAPLRQADDAIVMDNTELDQEEQLDIALGLVIDVIASEVG